MVSRDFKEVKERAGKKYRDPRNPLQPPAPRFDIYMSMPYQIEKARGSRKDRTDHIKN